MFCSRFEADTYYYKGDCMGANAEAEETKKSAIDRSESRGYGRFVRLPDTSAAVALGRARNAFGREGLGVVAEVDFRDTLLRKLDKDIGPYWTIEICNPKLADRALGIDFATGLLLPCKIAVWQDGKDAVVAALRPEVAVSIAGSDALMAIAREAEQHIERALVRLEGAELGPSVSDPL
jgi:uncharacterized protein (DUF302 family)